MTDTANDPTRQNQEATSVARSGGEQELSQAEAAAAKLAAEPRGQAYELLLAEIRLLRNEKAQLRDDARRWMNHAALQDAWARRADAVIQAAQALVAGHAEFFNGIETQWAPLIRALAEPTSTEATAPAVATPKGSA